MFVSPFVHVHIHVYPPLDSCDVGATSVTADSGEVFLAIAFVVSRLLVDKKFNGTKAHSHPV